MGNINKGKMVLVGCGGAGINMAVESYNTLNSLGNGFAGIDIKLIDTTEKTIQEHEEFRPAFSRIVTERTSVGIIDGTGGEKKDIGLVKDITTFTKRYVDEHKFTNDRNIFFVVMMSASGGTGGNVGAILTKLLMDKGSNVFVVTVGDSSNLLNTSNTLKTLNSLQRFAMGSKTALSIIYYNNTVDNNTTLLTEKDNNGKINKLLTVISGFVSGSINNLDMQDMVNFFRPTNYSTFTIDPGLYQLGVTSGVLEDKNTLLARTIVKNDSDSINITVKLKHNKTGIIPDTISDKFGDYPLYLIFRQQVIGVEVLRLEEELASIEEATKSTYEPFGSTGNDIDEEDEFALVL